MRTAAHQAWLFDDEAQVLSITLPRELWHDGGVVAVA